MCCIHVLPKQQPLVGTAEVPEDGSFCVAFVDTFARCASGWLLRSLPSGRGAVQWRKQMPLMYSIPPTGLTKDMFGSIRKGLGHPMILFRRHLDCC